MKENETDEVEVEVPWETDGDGNPFIDLRNPIQRKAGEDVERLTFHEFKVGELRALDKIKGKVAQGIYLVGKSARVPTTVVDEMGSLDFTLAQEIIAHFFGASPGDEDEDESS